MNKKKPVCKYGPKCYRKNPQHLKEYDHPKADDEDVEDEESEESDSSVEEESRKKGHHSPAKKPSPAKGGRKRDDRGKKNPEGDEEEPSPPSIPKKKAVAPRKRGSSEQEGGDSKKRRVTGGSENSESASEEVEASPAEPESSPAGVEIAGVPPVVLEEDDDEVMSSDGGEDSGDEVEMKKEGSKLGKLEVAYNPAEPASEEASAGKEDVSSGGDEGDLIEFECDATSSVEKAFLVRMPKDFHQFWDFAKAVHSKNPEDALLSAKLKLVGPFDVLAGKFDGKKVERGRLLRHWRYYYDPPEFQTVMANVSSDSGYHVGYWRDAPNEEPVCVAENDANDSKNGAKFRPIGENIFQAVHTHLVEAAAKASTFEKPKLQKLIKALQDYAKVHEIELDADYPTKPAKRKGSVANPFHGMGLVVPYDKKRDVGYRPIPETNASLTKMFQRLVSSSDESKDRAMEPIDELVTNVQFANDEGDPGMGLELGLNMFSFGGKPLHGLCESLLTVAYALLGRHNFAAILKAHLQNRKTGNELSILHEAEVSASDG